jgi:hypothetical protein
MPRNPGVRHIFAKRVGLLLAPRLAEKWGQKKGDVSEKLFLPPFFRQPGLAGSTHAKS